MASAGGGSGEHTDEDPGLWQKLKGILGPQPPSDVEDVLNSISTDAALCFYHNSTPSEGWEEWLKSQVIHYDEDAPAALEKLEELLGTRLFQALKSHMVQALDNWSQRKEGTGRKRQREETQGK
eukprot:gb/GECG01005527.1/.p1 GENE.gb/GECG01005527.1/~~gb/GECG01005527.1/.p1  ORF type:complete len:124 (+),score=18.11 gb/GECG01005527.1/:1-372(+)